MKILPPDINRSNADFKIVGEQILCGLTAIKTLGDETVAAILAEREQNGVFKSFADFCSRLQGKGLNNRSMEFLIKSGAFDAFDSIGIFDSYKADVRNLEQAILETRITSHVPNTGMVMQLLSKFHVKEFN